MTVHDDPFAVRLDSALAVDDRRDWLDVRRRAHRGRRRWLTRPTGLLAAALVVAGGGSLAIGVGQNVLGGDVPPKVRHELQHMTDSPFGPADGAPPWLRFPITKVVKGSEHRVLSARTPIGVATLYVARTVHGGWCMVTHGADSGGATCNDRGIVPGLFPITLLAPYVNRGHMLLLTGWAGQPGAYAVRYRLANRPWRRIVLREGWFMRAETVSRRHGYDIAAVFQVLDQDGHVLAQGRQPLQFMPRPVHFPKPVRSTVRLLTAKPLPNGGGTVTIWEARTASGQRCFRKLRQGKSQLTPAWQCDERVGRYGIEPPGPRHAPVEWDLGLRNDARYGPTYGWAYAYGWVAPSVAALKLRFQDGTQTDIPLLHGDFLYVVPRDKWPDGHRPSILLAYDARGRQVYRRFLYPRQHCVYPNSDPLCRNFAMGTG
jgi:hypothetical protein